MSHGASTDCEDPPRMSPAVFIGSAHDGGCIFVPTPGMPTPSLVHVKPTMGPLSPTPHEEAVQIEQIPGEDIKPMEGLRRSRRSPAQAPDCRTGDSKMRPVRAYGWKRKGQQHKVELQDLGCWNLPDSRFVVFRMTEIRVFIDEEVLENRRKYGISNGEKE
ncbi:hypothetical protein SO802_012387 [Lithocarpus litseifolius]|uniref:Uncharacterized protein n=1 Tax=Lithocarpus litseifolius TaxID=425828 RepID=A0AAW2D3C5_9ROSI